MRNLFVCGKGMNLLKMGKICEDKHFLLAIGGELCWVKSLTNGLDIFFAFYVIILHGRRGCSSTKYGLKSPWPLTKCVNRPQTPLFSN